MEEQIIIGTEQDRTNDYGDMRELIVDWFAQFSTNKLAGKSPTISGVKEKILKNIIKRNRWNTLQRVIVRKLSTDGEVAGTITLDKDKTPIFMVADSIAEYTRTGDKIVKQRHITNYTIGTRPVMLDEDFYFENGVPTVKRSIKEYDPEKGVDIKVQDGLKLLEDFGIHLKEKETFNGDKLPCFHIENLPMPGGRGRSDTYGADALINAIQNSWNRLNWDEDVNIPKIFKYKQAGSFRSNDYSDIKNKYVGKGIIEEVETISTIVGENNSPITIYNSQYQAGEIFKVFKQKLSTLFEKQGFARDIASEKGTAQQTEFELQQARNSEYSTFLTKEDNLQQGFTEMLEIGLAMANKPNIDISVKINVIEVRDPMVQVELMAKALEIGVMSRKEAIKDYNRIGDIEADKYMGEIDKEKEEAFNDNPINTAGDNPDNPEQPQPDKGE